MPLRNRVTPFGELIADPARGLVYGNRGCLHDADGRIVRHHAVRRWIGCRLEFRGWQRGPLLQPGKFTELFFLDEATAFAAGHRPCALCRHDDYRRFTERWRDLHPSDRGADAIDLTLHGERWDATAKRQRRYRSRVRDLPTGVFVALDEVPHLVLDRSLRSWTPAGYTDTVPTPRGDVDVLTPPSLVQILATGWEGALPLLHPSART